MGVDPQLAHPTAHVFGIAKIARAFPRKPGIHRRLYPGVEKGIKPLVKRDDSGLNLRLLDFLFDHCRECNLWVTDGWLEFCFEKYHHSLFKDLLSLKAILCVPLHP